LEALSFSVEHIEINVTDRSTTLNQKFPTRVVAENGAFGRIWSNDIMNAIRSSDEARIYRDARLVEANIGGRNALVRTDINWFQVDERGRTNLERISRDNPLSPIAPNGQTVELHHIGQRRDSPLAELTTSEHRGSCNDTVLHDKSITSDAHAPDTNWDAERREYWEKRAEADITQSQRIPSAVRTGHDFGVREARTAAIITAGISTGNNMRALYNGEVTAQEAALNIARDTGTAAAIGYGTGFISGSVSALTSNSAHKVVRALGNTGVTGAAISMGIASYNDVAQFARGEIDEKEFAINMGSNASGVAGAIAGAKIGAVAGSVVPVVGTVVGALAGGTVGYLITTSAYATAVEVATSGIGVLTDKTENVIEGASELLNSAREMGQSILINVATTAPEALETVRNGLNDVASTLRLPFRL
jgi:hypothetical protein